MGVHSLIETWLAEASLPSNLTRVLDEDGFFFMPYGSVSLTLAVPEQEPYFVLYVPLMSVSGLTPRGLSEFYHHLLVLQLRGDLPLGMSFGMELDGSLLCMAGSYRVKGLDASSFDMLIREVVSAAEPLRESLERLYMDFAKADDAGERSDTGSAPAPAAPIRELSDADLLNAQLTQALRF